MTRTRDIIQRPPGTADTDEMQVVIVRVSDGVQRIDRPGWKPCNTWKDEFWWTDGNAGCDCNRRMFFARAVEPNEPEPACGENECGNTEFYVILRSPVAAS